MRNKEKAKIYRESSKVDYGYFSAGYDWKRAKKKVRMPPQHAHQMGKPVSRAVFSVFKYKG